ncbi:PhzF family phenazine biosynthesis protein [Halomonas sp. WWR20]
MPNDTQYYLLDVFTDRAFAGNPLAVFPFADELDTVTMQAIANELNLSETVFVGQAGDTARYPIRIFTPTMELPFAGHPTVGTAHLLAELGMARRDTPLTLEVGIGSLVVDFEKDRARFTTAQPVDIRASPLSQQTAARLLGLDERQIISQPVPASCGVVS